MPNRRDTLVAYLHPDHVAASFQQSYADLVLADVSSPDGIIADGVRSHGGGWDISTRRNEAVEKLLAGDLKWLFFIDADMGFQPNALAELRRVADAAERPIVGGLCFTWKNLGGDGSNGLRCAAVPTIYDWALCDDGYHRYTARHAYPVNRVVPAAATGAACLLIHRSALEVMLDGFGRTWFDRTLGDDGQQLGEDIAFFDRCRRLGVPVHVHTGVRTTHSKTTWVGELDFWRTIQAPPATELVDVIVPVLHRPQNVKPLMDSLRASTGLARAWFVIERGDVEVRSLVCECGANAIEYSGSFADKVNHAYGAITSDAPWILLCGDDVRFRPGWLDHAEAVGNLYDAGVVGTNDLGNPHVMAGNHATHMLIRRSYIDEVGATFDGTPGVVCGPYRHCFVDNELVLAAMKRGAWQMALGSIVEHLHPLWGKGEEDDVYRLGYSFYEQDEALFNERAERFFGGQEVA